MIAVQLTYNYGFRWYSESEISVKGIAIHPDGRVLREKGLSDYFIGIDSSQLFAKRLRELNGIFAVVIRREKELYAAVDRLRNIPLFYGFLKKTLSLSDDYHAFTADPSAKLNDDALFYMRSFGYTPDRQTLIDNLFQLQSGEYLHYRDEVMELTSYCPIAALPAFPSDKTAAKRAFADILEQTTERLIRQINNRPVALPLSGGMDSRLIGLMLKRGGVKEKDILCFTYGNRNSREVAGSKAIAARLGFPWQLIDYEQFIGMEYLHTRQFEQYVDFCGNAVSFPYIQEYFAGKQLKEQLHLPEETLFLPGHSGDMVGGSHLYPDMETFASEGQFATKVVQLRGKQIPLPPRERERLISQLAASVDASLSGYSHRMHDQWNVRERQAKQTVNSAKVWNYFGYEYLLPLWDYRFAEFFFSLPFSLRVYKRFYEEQLREQFAANNLLLPHETRSGVAARQCAYLKIRLKERFPFLEKLKKPDDSMFDFFHFKELLAPMWHELPAIPFNEKNALLTEWYIRRVMEELKASNE